MQRTAKRKTKTQYALRVSMQRTAKRKSCQPPLLISRSNPFFYVSGRIDGRLLTIVQQSVRTAKSLFTQNSLTRIYFVSPSQQSYELFKC
jgi:hypothetical protein